MRLINIETLQLEEYFDRTVPPYAILSHRWDSEEVGFKEVSKKRLSQIKKGYEKLVEACQMTAIYDIAYLWIDTACIDKSSSAELSEAINSVHFYYENAEICLAHPEDVIDDAGLETHFSESVWFTRSWTLQERRARLNHPVAPEGA